MDDRWVGIQAGVDPGKWAALLRRAHAASLGGVRTSAIVRPVISASWDRSVDNGVEPDADLPRLQMEPADARARWEEHPLARAADVIREVLEPLLHHGEHVAVVSDADGTLLWSTGPPNVLRAADAIGFSPGFNWNETGTGTNAVGTALATEHPIQIFSAEHFRPAVHSWQCSAAPVRDPLTGSVLGAIDISGAFSTAHPLTLALVATAARLVEEALRRERAERDRELTASLLDYVSRFGGPAVATDSGGRIIASTPHNALWPERIDIEGGGDPRLPDGTSLLRRTVRGGILITPSPGASGGARTTIRVAFLEAPTAVVISDRGMLPLSLRHSEIAALLALRPAGAGARALAEMLYGTPDREPGVRVELHRLRPVLGPLLQTRPYRLVPAETDLNAALAEGRSHPQTLIPASKVPLIVAARGALIAGRPTS